MDLQEIYQKKKYGDSITDEELGFLINELRAAVRVLSELGPVFELARKELTMDLFDLESYAEARRRNRNERNRRSI